MYNFDSIKITLNNLQSTATHLQMKMHEKQWQDDEVVSLCQSLNDCLSGFNNANATESYQSAIQFAGKASAYANSIAQRLEKYVDNELYAIGEIFRTHSDALMTSLAPTALPSRPLSDAELRLISDAERLYQEELQKLQLKISENEKQDERHKKLLRDNEIRIAGLEQKLLNLEKRAQAEIDKISLAYTDSEKEIVTAKNRIDDLLVLAGKDVVAGDYTESAASEKQMADNLRYASLVCMAMIAIALGYSFWETTTVDFDWKRSVFRISFAFLLSVPAAYLARESAKHRQQQYEHLQTSLDLKAISPFVASLPEDEQHKIKILIASKIFAGRDFSKTGADSYPINIQELVMEIIKKLDTPLRATKPDGQ